LFQSLTKIGEQLIGLHLTNPRNAADMPESAIHTPQSAIDSFHVGTYNVCRKWLQMEGETPESAAFQRLRSLIARTIELHQEIDQRIETAGGFPAAFRTG
jgi:hypothetical protein